MFDNLFLVSCARMATPQIPSFRTEELLEAQLRGWAQNGASRRSQGKAPVWSLVRPGGLRLSSWSGSGHGLQDTLRRKLFDNNDDETWLHGLTSA